VVPPSSDVSGAVAIFLLPEVAPTILPVTGTIVLNDTGQSLPVGTIAPGLRPSVVIFFPSFSILLRCC